MELFLYQCWSNSNCDWGNRRLKKQKFMKLTDHTHACNDLTNFEYVVHAMTGNGCYLNLQKLACKNSWNHFGQTFFWRVLAIENHCAAAWYPAAASASRAQAACRARRLHWTSEQQAIITQLNCSSCLHTWFCTDWVSQIESLLLSTTCRRMLHKYSAGHV